MTRPLAVYAAHPMTAYGTDHEARALRRIAEAFDGWDVLNPAVMFDGDASWHDTWPQVLSGIDACAIFADETGCIGVGCLKEIADAIVAYVPVVALGPRGGVRLLGGVAVEGGPIVDRVRIGRLLYGPAVPVSRVADLAHKARRLRTLIAGRSVPIGEKGP
ncbi:MAG: hypothetical protein M0020_05810 [Actinomycetota bacterium]|nr:hypothetical protein [Actinomycetota bacterium]